MSFAKQAITVPAVDVELLEHTVALVFSAVSPTDDEPSGGDKLLDGADLTDTLDTTAEATDADADTVGALFQRAAALYSYCGKEKPPRHLLENGFPGRVLCAAAATSPLFKVPGATPNLVAYDLDPEAMRAAIAAAQN